MVNLFESVVPTCGTDPKVSPDHRGGGRRHRVAAVADRGFRPDGAAYMGYSPSRNERIAGAFGGAATTTERRGAARKAATIPPQQPPPCNQPP
jgi:hypothetical protein